MEKEFLYKKVPAVLCAAAVVVSAATASHFSYGYEQSKAQVEALSTSLKEAQEQLAELVGISRQHMGAIEAPNICRPISLELLFNIAAVLEIDPAKLLIFRN